MFSPHQAAHWIRQPRLRIFVEWPRSLRAAKLCDNYGDAQPNKQGPDVRVQETMPFSPDCTDRKSE